MEAAELIAAIRAAPDRAVRKPLLAEFTRQFAAHAQFPSLLRSLPANLRLRAAARALRLVRDDATLCHTIIRAVTQNQSRSRSLQKLIRLQSLIARCPALDEAVARADVRTKLACPKCSLRLRRSAFIAHLWQAHRLVFENGIARDPGPLLESAIRKAVTTHEPEEFDRVYNLGAVYYKNLEPLQIHQALASRMERDPEELAPLCESAKEHHCGLCPRCLAKVPSPIPPLPPPLLVSHGRVIGNEQATATPESSKRRRAVIATLPIAILGLFTILILPSPIILLVATVVITVAAYCLIRRVAPREIDNDDAIDRAWRELVPRLGRSPSAVQFLTRLCRTSLEHGHTEQRSDIVWSQVEQAAVLSGKGGYHLQWFATVRVLQAYDAAHFGQDWIPNLVAILAPLFRAEATPAYAEAVAETLHNSPVLSDPSAARLRVLLATEAFAAGLGPVDLVSLEMACPHLDRLLAGNEDWFRALYVVWRNRKRRGWTTIADAKAVFEYALNPASGRLLAQYPDTLLVHRFEESFDRDLGPILVGRRGVTILDQTVSDLNTEISVSADGDGSILIFGPHRIASRRKLPRRVAGILTGWLQFREELLTDAQVQYQPTELLTKVLTPLATQCPICHQPSLVRFGELNSSWPLH